MPVSSTFRTFVVDQLSRVVPRVRARSMFGGVGIYAGELFFALIADDTLYFKVDDSNRPDFEARGMGPFRPYGADHIETFASRRYFPPAMNVIPQWLRDVFGKALGPVAQLLIRFHIRPNAITTVGTVLIVASAVAFALGRIHWAGFLLLVSGLFDMVDGRVAREGGMTTTFGAFYDSTLDRVGESALFTGIGVYFLRGGVAPDRMMPAVLACFVGLAASLLVSYTRARAEGLGLSVKIGIAQRAERVLLLGAPTLFFGPGNQGALLFWIVIVLALATTVTVVQRVIYVARVAGDSAARPVPRQRDTLPGHAPALQSRKGH